MEKIKKDRDKDRENTVMYNKESQPIEVKKEISKIKNLEKYNKKTQ